MLSSNYEEETYIRFVDDCSYIAPGTIIEVHGYEIKKPERFKNLAHERGFEIALILALKEGKVIYSQRMGDMILEERERVILTTHEIIHVIKHIVRPVIQLREDAANPSKVAHDAMNYVDSFFLNGIIIKSNIKRYNKMKTLELKRD